MFCYTKWNKVVKVLDSFPHSLTHSLVWLHYRNYLFRLDLTNMSLIQVGYEFILILLIFYPDFSCVQMCFIYFVFEDVMLAFYTSPINCSCYDGFIPPPWRHCCCGAKTEPVTRRNTIEMFIYLKTWKLCLDTKYFFLSSDCCQALHTHILYIHTHIYIYLELTSLLQAAAVVAYVYFCFDNN